MPSIRRGVEAVTEFAAARAAVGCIASRNGSGIATPTPWRKRRRERAWRVAMRGARNFIGMMRARRRVSLGLEQFALDDFLDEGAHAVLALLRPLQDALQFVAVGVAH